LKGGAGGETIQDVRRREGSFEQGLNPRLLEKGGDPSHILQASPIILARIPEKLDRDHALHIIDGYFEI
jgi:hypothetical protein